MFQMVRLEIIWLWCVQACVLGLVFRIPLAMKKLRFVVCWHRFFSWADIR